MSYILPLEADKYYHIFNRGNNKETLFKSNDNYQYFLKKYQQHINPVAETLAYCLMPNHFHFFVRIKPARNSVRVDKPSRGDISSRDVTSANASEAFRKLFIGYTMAFNKQQNRTGTLFQRPFKRIHIDKDNYYTAIINYIHRNPIHHGFCKTVEEWKYTSFHDLTSNNPTFLNRDEVISWFGSKTEFVMCQQSAAQQFLKEIEKSEC